MVGHPDPLLADIGVEPDRSVVQTVEVRCRKCETCLMHRRRHWTARAISETRSSLRTWFGTLTLRPDRATWAHMSALKRLADAEHRDAPPQRVFEETAKSVGPELQRFLKRCRKLSSAHLRYLLVCEAHQSGLPHWHMLLHEHQGSISKRSLEACWRFGFSQWRLVDVEDPRAAGYVCKYISKETTLAPRASIRYGSAGAELATERVIGATRLLKEKTETPRLSQVEVKCTEIELNENETNGTSM